MQKQLHPWPNGVRKCLIAEGMDDDKAEAFATILRRAVTDITASGHEVYNEHTPKRVALAGKLRRDGFAKAAALVWHDHEDREQLELRVGIERLHHMYADVILNESGGA